jgi:predicted DNA-binding transcriptional regulator
MEEKLQKLGFSKTEAEIYLYILSQGRVSPAIVSKDTGIKRPTVYAAASELVRKGVVTEDLGGRSKYLTASPNDLEKLVIAEKQRVLEEEVLVDSLLPELKALSQSAQSPIPRIRYVRESDLKDFFYKQTSVWNQSMLDTRETSWWGYNSIDLTEQKFVREWIDHYWRTSPKKIDLHLFSPEHEGEKKIQKIDYGRRHIKYWNEEHHASQWILGDYIVTLVTNQKPQYSIQIKDRLMAESLRRIYRRLWNYS